MHASPTEAVMRVLEEIYQRGMNRATRDLMNCLGLHWRLERMTRAEAIRWVQKLWAAEVERRRMAERERDVALAWAAWWKALYERALEDEVDRDDAGLNAAINAAEEALLQLGIDPNKDEP
jgi:hypothetical protein